VDYWGREEKGEKEEAGKKGEREKER